MPPLLSVVLSVAVSVPLGQPPEPPLLHFDLKRSVPAADSTVAALGEVRLWFTEVPQAGSTQTRVMSGDTRVPTGDVQVDSHDATSVFVATDTPLLSGRYRVLWRSMAPDGHVVDGEFSFVVASVRPARRPPA